MLQKWQRRKYLQRCKHAVTLYDLLEAKGEPEEPVDADRASGLVVCQICNRPYFDHPPHPFEPCLTVTCGGEILKL